MTVVTASEARQRWGRTLDAARMEPVIITEHGRPVVVLMDYDLSRTALDALARTSESGHPGPDATEWRRDQENRIDALAERLAAHIRPGTPPLTDVAGVYARRPAKA